MIFSGAFRGLPPWIVVTAIALLTSCDQQLPLVPISPDVLGVSCLWLLFRVVPKYAPPNGADSAELSVPPAASSLRRFPVPVPDGGDGPVGRRPSRQLSVESGEGKVDVFNGSYDVNSSRPGARSPFCS